MMLALAIGWKLGIASLCLLTALAFGFAAEILRPDTPQEEAARVGQEPKRADAWEGFDVAKAHWEEKELYEVASFETEARPERVIEWRRAA